MAVKKWWNQPSLTFFIGSNEYSSESKMSCPNDLHSLSKISSMLKITYSFTVDCTRIQWYSTDTSIHSSSHTHPAITMPREMSYFSTAEVSVPRLVLWPDTSRHAKLANATTMRRGRKDSVNKKASRQIDTPNSSRGSSFTGTRKNSATCFSFCSICSSVLKTPPLISCCKYTEKLRNPPAGFSSAGAGNASDDARSGVEDRSIELDRGLLAGELSNRLRV